LAGALEDILRRINKILKEMKKKVSEDHKKNILMDYNHTAVT